MMSCGRLQQAADDLDALALADRKVADQRIGIERQAVAVGQRLRLGRDRADRRLVVERKRDVLGRRQRLEQRKMLEHHADAELSRSARAGDASPARPFQRISPELGSSEPNSILTSVDLPAPFSPSSA